MNMNSSPMSDSKGGFSLLHNETHDFTEADKSEALSVLHLMARSLVDKNDKLAREYFYVVSHLQSLSPDQVREYLVLYLAPEKLINIINVKSFIYLKRTTEDFTEENKLLQKKLADKVVMEVIHIIFYKTLPCTQGGHCKYYPRKIVHKNDFLDMELDCYFYHHEKDRRRFVLNDSDKEFRYAGNFADGKKPLIDKSSFSQNFFESLFHPLYYKNFKCVRLNCEQSVFCPYFHSEEEKTIMAVIFKGFFGKPREVFTKKKTFEEDDVYKLKFKKISNFGNRRFIKGQKIPKY